MEGHWFYIDKNVHVIYFSEFNILFKTEDNHAPVTLFILFERYRNYKERKTNDGTSSTAAAVNKSWTASAIKKITDSSISCKESSDIFGLNLQVHCRKLYNTITTNQSMISLNIVILFDLPLNTATVFLYCKCLTAEVSRRH